MPFMGVWFILMLFEFVIKIPTGGGYLNAFAVIVVAMLYPMLYRPDEKMAQMLVSSIREISISLTK